MNTLDKEIARVIKERVENPHNLDILNNKLDTLRTMKAIGDVSKELNCLHDLRDGLSDVIDELDIEHGFGSQLTFSSWASKHGFPVEIAKWVKATTRMPARPLFALVRPANHRLAANHVWHIPDSYIRQVYLMGKVMADNENMFYKDTHDRKDRLEIRDGTARILKRGNLESPPFIPLNQALTQFLL